MSAQRDPAPGAKIEYLLRLGDTSLVLAQRLGEWLGRAPAIEEDLGLANIALDLLGQARLILAHAGKLEGRGRDEDALAFFRAEGEYRNLTLVETPNGDFGRTIVRQFLIDAWQFELYGALAASSDRDLAAIAAKAVKETRYHLRYSSGWLVRLGDGTEESHRRVQESLDALWPYTRELFEADAIDRAMQSAGVAPDLGSLEEGWSRQVTRTLQEAGLERPADRYFIWAGKRGQHTEHLGYLLAELQYMQRTYPGATW
jgi:ring-1,2-phenylacetyl-CoA epoxidase subunit PaaC